MIIDWKAWQKSQQRHEWFNHVQSVSSSMPIVFCSLQTGICQSFLMVLKCFSIKIQGLSRYKWMRENFKNLKKETLKIQWFSSCVLSLVIMASLSWPLSDLQKWWYQSNKGIYITDTEVYFSEIAEAHGLPVWTGHTWYRSVIAHFYYRTRLEAVCLYELSQPA